MSSLRAFTLSLKFKQLTDLERLTSVVQFHRAGTLRKEMARKVNVMACISFAGLTFMVLVSLGPVRRRYYEFFKWGHHLGLAVFIAGLNFHSSPFSCATLFCLSPL